MEVLAGGGEGEVKVLAGGTDLIPKLKGRLIAMPKCVLDLKGIGGLDYVREEGGGGLAIGALASLSSVGGSFLVKERFSVLAEAVGSIASRQIQNRGTVVGNLCNAVPSADSAPALLCLEAMVECVSVGGERSVPVEEFFVGPQRTVLGRDEVVREIRIPALSERARGVYVKLSPRSRMDLAVVGVAAVVLLEGGVVKDVRIGLGAVAPRPMRAKKAEGVLRGQSSRDELLAQAAKVASEEARPISDHRASGEYRRMMVEVLVRRALGRCVQG